MLGGRDRSGNRGRGGNSIEMSGSRSSPSNSSMEQHRSHPSSYHNNHNSHNPSSNAHKNNNAPQQIYYTDRERTSSSVVSLQHTNSLRSNSLHSLPDTHLTAKPHAFAGSILNPKHARELTPKVVLAVTHTLGVQALENAHNNAAANNNNSANGINPTKSTDDDDGNSTNTPNNNPDQALEAKVQYTIWITEAWKILGWAEPSAALFWEMATMYHTLHVAGRSIEVEEKTSKSKRGNRNKSDRGGRNGDNDDEDDDDDDASSDQMIGIKRTLSQSIPPILSCGSSASMDSTDNKKKNVPDSPSSMGSGSTKQNFNTSTNLNSPSASKKNFNNNESKIKSSHNMKASAAAAKELPVWLVGMFLLLHCEEKAFLRNLSGEDERRFDALMAKQGAGANAGDIWKEKLGKGMDFGTLLMHPSLSPRTQIHAEQHLDHTNCTVYLLRHLRKFLLLCAVPHNTDALEAINDLLDGELHDDEYTNRQLPPSSKAHPTQITADADVLLRRHEEEHNNIGLDIRLSSEDLERLNLVLQAPSGGLIDDPPLYISSLMTQEDFDYSGGILLEEVEQEVRRHLEMELLHVDNEDLSQAQHEEKDDGGVDSASNDMASMGLSDEEDRDHGDGSNSKFHVDRIDDYQKELSYTKLRGTTILLKPNSHPDNNEHDEEPSDRSQPPAPSLPNNGRLHDVHVSDCSDANMYLLQPFEHATISACVNCTIVVGAVAGLLHVVDCEHIKITSAARRVLVSNCFDVSHFIFTPSPPLLVGDNRSCQFAPYNSYYDGLREDLLATGLAAAVISPDNVVVGDSVHGPALQCASNKWKQPMELAKLSEIPQIHSMQKKTAADDKALSKAGTGEDTMQTPTLVPASEFQVLFVPLESESHKLRNRQQEMNMDDNMTATTDDASVVSGPKSGMGSQYCHCLGDVLQLSPFRLPTEYERRALVKAERMKSLQQAIQTDLTPEQQMKLGEELNKGFRDWLVTSGNLRQVLDLVHLERKGI